MKALYGESFPLMTMYERVLNLLAMRIVDDIVFDAPFVISKEIMNHMNVDYGWREKVLANL